MSITSQNAFRKFIDQLVSVRSGKIKTISRNYYKMVSNCRVKSFDGVEKEV